MAKLRSVSDTKLTQLNTEAAKLLKQNVWPVGKITKSIAQQMYKATSKLLDEYHKNVNKKCDELRKENVTKKLPENLLTKPKNNTKFNTTNETNKTNHSNRRNTMNKNIDIITNKINDMVDVINTLAARIADLERKTVTPVTTEEHKPRFKKLRERSREEAPKSVKVEPKKVVKKANKEQKAEIVKLQKKAQEGKKLLTKKQLAQYTRLWHAKWQEVNKTIDINDKAARSLAFAKGRISCLKKARTY